MLELGGDRHAVWTLSAGGAQSAPTAIVVNSAGFVVAGSTGVPGDFDPGADIDIVGGGASFLARYSF